MSKDIEPSPLADGALAAITEEAAARDTASLGVPVHPVAATFPWIEGEGFDCLVEDVRRNGVRSAVTFDQHGRLLDGRNRWLAAKAAGRLHEIEPRRVNVTDEEAIALIFALNVNRRHLSKGQAAMAVAMAYPVAKRGRGNIDPAGKAAEAAGIHVRRLQEARAILCRSLPIAREVLAGRVSVEAAIVQLNAAKRDAEHKEIAARSEAWEAKRRAQAEKREQAEAKAENIRYIAPKSSTPTPERLPALPASPANVVTEFRLPVSPAHPGTFDRPERVRLEQAIGAHTRQLDREAEGRRIPARLFGFMLAAVNPDRFDAEDEKAAAREALEYLRAHQEALAMAPEDEAAQRDQKAREAAQADWADRKPEGAA
jgi:hypothetical protein